MALLFSEVVAEEANYRLRRGSRGKALTYDWALNESKLDLHPKKLALGPIATDEVAMPGKTPLI